MTQTARDEPVLVLARELSGIGNGVGPASVTGALPTINMQDFTGYERGCFQVHHRVDDVLDVAHAAQGMHACKDPMCFFGVHWRLNDAWRDCVNANTALGIFDGERLCGRVQAAFGQ